MKIDGMLENAGLEQIASVSPTPAYPGRIYTDITDPANAIARVYTGTAWLPLLTAYQKSSFDTANLGLLVTVGSSALTVALKQMDGATDPTPASPVYASFRSATLTNGSFSQQSVTAALSLTVPSTATLGTTNATPAYLYVYLINNAGVLELAISGTKYDEGTTYSTTTIAAGSNTLATIYSTTGRASKAVRLVGRINVTEATAGTWATLPTEVAVKPFT